MTDTLSRNLMISLAAHFAVVLVIFFQAILIPHDPLDLRNAIRVDVVGLPDKIEQLAEKPAPKPAEPEKKPKLPPKEAAPEPVAKPIAPVIPSPKAKKIDLSKSQKKALERLEKMAAAEKALEKIKDKLNEEKKAATVAKGNQVNEGDSPTGLEKIAFDRYLSELKARVLSNYSIPEWMADAKPKAQVQVLIDERGNVIRRTVIRSSGNTVFDNNALAAVDASSPLPAPPKRLRSRLENIGMTLGFPE